MIPGAVKASAAKPAKKTRKVRWQIDCAVSPIRKIVLGFLLGIGQSRKHSRGRFPGPPVLRYRIASLQRGLAAAAINSNLWRWVQRRLHISLPEISPLYLPSRSGPCDNIFKRNKPSAAVK